jgi:hypothetical protein
MCPSGGNDKGPSVNPAPSIMRSCGRWRVSYDSEASPGLGVDQ